MAALTTQSDTALSRIEPSDDDKDNAPAAHTGVRTVLKDDDTLKAWGIDPVLIGSYKRQVSIRRVKDVDVFCRLASLPDAAEPADVLTRFFHVLDDAYGNDADGEPRVRPQARSVQVLFPEYDGLYVDAVPARPNSDGVTWEIPLKEPSDDEKWKQTNPEQLTVLTSVMNDTSGGLYVPTVKLLRQTRRALLGRSEAGKRPGGLLVDIAAYTACVNGWVTGTNQSHYYASALAGVARVIEEYVNDGTEIPDPTLEGESLSIRATDAQWERARKKFNDAAEQAKTAAETDDRCAAAKTFRDLLGGNDDHDFVFDMPDGCNDDGTRAAASRPIVAGDRHVAAGDGRFG